MILHIEIYLLEIGKNFSFNDCKHEGHTRWSTRRGWLAMLLKRTERANL